MNDYNTRIIAKLEIKSSNVVKPVHFEGLRKVGDPLALSNKYYADGVDEIIYIDIVASLYQRNISYSQLKRTSSDIFVPLTAGGGIHSIDQCQKLFEAGADKVSINTFALQQNPEIINDAAKIFGSQAVVVNIEAKYRNGSWECFSDNGRIPSGKDVLEWAKEVEDRGSGEILLQSIDTDGRKEGFDLDLIRKVIDNVQIPVIVASGAGNIKDIISLIKDCNPSGIAISSILHYNKYNISEIKESIDNEFG